MAKFSAVLFLTMSGLVLASAQYGQQSAPVPSASYSGASAAAPAPAFNAPSGAPSQGPAAPVASSSFNGGSSGGSSGGSGDLTVQCRAAPDGSGKIKYDCSGVNKDAITLKTEHFLWLENQGGNSQNLDIEIPNYNIDEFIRAAYKALGPQEGAKINILLKKPDITYNAAKDDAQPQQVGQPSVSVNYQPVDKVSVHYPTQKQYTSGGPSAPPPGAGSSSSSSSSSAGPAPGPATGGIAPAAGPAPGAYSRPQRESGYRYYFIRQ